MRRFPSGSIRPTEAVLSSSWSSSSSSVGKRRPSTGLAPVMPASAAIAATVAGASPESTSSRMSFAPEVLDGLAGVGPKLLGQHRQAEGAGIARRARDRVDRAERLCRHAQRNDAPAAGRLGAGPGLERAEREQLRRAQDVAAVGQLNRAPLPTTRERNLRFRGLAVAGKGRLERLQGRVRARKRGGEPSESARQGVLADTGGRSERGDAEARLGQGSGLVEADRCRPRRATRWR